jgi:hypothetical protein
MALGTPTYSLTEDASQLHVVVALPGCLNAAPLECVVSAAALSLTDARGYFAPLAIPLPLFSRGSGSWADCSYTAKFSKKQQTLTLTLPKPPAAAAPASPAPPSPIPAALASAPPISTSLQEEALRAALDDLSTRSKAPTLAAAAGTGRRGVAVVASEAAATAGAADATIGYVWVMPPYASARTMRPAAAHENLFEVTPPPPLLLYCPIRNVTLLEGCYSAEGSVCLCLYLSPRG